MKISPLFLLIVPKIPREEIVFPKSVLVKIGDDPLDDEALIFKDKDEYLSHSGEKLRSEQIMLPAKYKDLPLIYIDGFGLFVSRETRDDIIHLDPSGLGFGAILFFDE